MAGFRARYSVAPNEPATGSTYFITPADTPMAKWSRALYVGVSGDLEVTLTGDASSYGILPAAIDTSSGNITIKGHGFEKNDRVMVVNTGGALPSGLAIQTAYYVIFVDVNTIQLSASWSGSAIIPSTQGTGTHAIFKSALLANAAIGYHPLACKQVNSATTAESIMGLY